MGCGASSAIHEEEDMEHAHSAHATRYAAGHEDTEEEEVDFVSNPTSGGEETTERPVLLEIKKSFKVLSARVRHGINDDPDQFQSSTSDRRDEPTSPMMRDSSALTLNERSIVRWFLDDHIKAVLRDDLHIMQTAAAEPPADTSTSDNGEVQDVIAMAKAHQASAVYSTRPPVETSEIISVASLSQPTHEDNRSIGNSSIPSFRIPNQHHRERDDHSTISVASSTQGRSGIWSPNAHRGDNSTADTLVIDEVEHHELSNLTEHPEWFTMAPATLLSVIDFESLLVAAADEDTRMRVTLGDFSLEPPPQVVPRNLSLSQTAHNTTSSAQSPGHGLATCGSQLLSVASLLAVPELSLNDASGDGGSDVHSQVSAGSPHPLAADAARKEPSKFDEVNLKYSGSIYKTAYDKSVDSYRISANDTRELGLQWLLGRGTHSAALHRHWVDALPPSAAAIFA